MQGRQPKGQQVEEGAAENGAEEDLGGLTAEELRQGQEAALALEDMLALSAQTLVRAEVDELYQQVRPLGQGRFGRVLLVTHRQKGTGPGDGGGAGGLVQHSGVVTWAQAETSQGYRACRAESISPLPSKLWVLGMSSLITHHACYCRDHGEQRSLTPWPSHVASSVAVQSQAVCWAPSKAGHRPQPGVFLPGVHMSSVPLPHNTGILWVALRISVIPASPGGSAHPGWCWGPRWGSVNPPRAPGAATEPGPGWPEEQKSISSQSWRLKVRGQGVSRVGSS